MTRLSRRDSHREHSFITIYSNNKTDVNKSQQNFAVTIKFQKWQWNFLQFQTMRKISNRRFYLSMIFVQFEERLFRSLPKIENRWTFGRGLPGLVGLFTDRNFGHIRNLNEKICYDCSSKLTKFSGIFECHFYLFYENKYENSCLIFFSLGFFFHSVRTTFRATRCL